MITKYLIVYIIDIRYLIVYIIDIRYLIVFNTRVAKVFKQPYINDQYEHL